MTAPEAPVLSPAQAAAAEEARFHPLARWLRRWLGFAEHRAEFNQLGQVLTGKDMTLEATREEQARHATVLAQVVDQLNRTTVGVEALDGRVQFYEARVPSLANAKKQYAMAVKRETARREGLIKAHPEWPEELKAHVRVYGKLPEPTTGEIQAAIEDVTKVEGAP